MAFTLPKYTELTDQQKIIAGLAYDKNILVSAPPGTGKTVIALYRAKELSDARKKIAVLVYNRPLMLYIQSVAKKISINAEINTWHSWLVDFYKTKFKTGYPKINGENFTYDWPKIKYDLERWATRNSYSKYDSMLFDESQDFPIEFLEAIKPITKSITCFMDSQQSIVAGGADTADVANVLGVRSAYTLYQNFRNCQEIYDLAKVYRDSDADARPPIHELPHFVRDTGFGIPLDKMVNILKRRSLPYIGIFAKPIQLRRIYDTLVDELPGRNIYLYKTQSDCNFKDFSKEGIYIMSFNCMKGLEFDEVIVPRFDHIDLIGDEDADVNLVYVSITRASHYFYGIYQSEDRKSGCIDVMEPFRTGEADKKLVRWE